MCGEKPGRDGGKQKRLEGSVALTLFRQDKLREPHVKIQSTFPLSLNGIEAKGTHILPLLEFF